MVTSKTLDLSRPALVDGRAVATVNEPGLSALKVCPLRPTLNLSPISSSPFDPPDRDLDCNLSDASIRF